MAALRNRCGPLRLGEGKKKKERKKKPQDENIYGLHALLHRAAINNIKWFI